MRRTPQAVLLLLLIILLSTPLYANRTIISALIGTVDISPSKDAAWETASRGKRLSEGASVRTGSDGRAVILFSNSTRIWVKENTTIHISEQTKRSHRVRVRKGRIKARVPHLRFRERFRLRTRTSIVAVRGTVLTLEADDSGEAIADVLFGEVQLTKTDPDGDRVLDKISIPQGNRYVSGLVKLLTPDQEILGLEDWSPGLSPEERRKDLIENAKKRAALREFVAQASATEREISESQQQIKEEDFAAGRTLVDVHGNIVRVDQRLDRPDNRTLQVLNVVKRNSYAAGGFRKYIYNGSDAARIDSVTTKIEFDQDLPSSLNELPGFFSANENTIKVARTEIIFAHSGDSDNVFTMALMGIRDPAADDITPDLYVGTLQTGGGKSGRAKLFELRQQTDLSVPGLTHFTEDSGIAQITEEGTNELYGNFAQRWVDAGGSGQTLWLASEFFVINNAGSVRSLTDFTQGSLNFDSLFKDTAAQLGLFAKADASNLPSSADAQNFAGGNSANKNIDVVILPDIFFSIIKSLASSLDSISGSLDDSFNSLSNAK